MRSEVPTCWHTLPQNLLPGSILIAVADCVEDGLGEDREGRVLERLIIHVAGDDPVVFAEALDHERLDERLDTQQKLVERIRHGRLDHLLGGGGLLADLLEEQAVFLGKAGAETVVEHFHDLGQGRFLFLRLSGTHVCRTLHALRLPFVKIDLARGCPLQTVVLQPDLVADLHPFGVAVEGEMRQQKAPEVKAKSCKGCEYFVEGDQPM